MRLKLDILNSKYTKAAGLYTIGNVFNRAISLLLLPIFTKLLNTTSYGIASTYNSWVAIIVVIISLQLNLTLRSAWTDKRKNLDAYISSVTTLTILVTIALALISLPICSLFFRNIPLLLVLFCIAQSFSTSIINMEIQREMMAVQYIKRTLLLSLPNLIAAILGIVVLLVYPDSQYYGRIIPMVCTYLVIGSLILNSIYKKGRTIFDVPNWKYGLSYSIPLVFHGIANTVLSGLDFSMITYYKSASETGIYSVAYTMGMAVIVITSSLESVWIPWFTEHMNKGLKDDVNKMAKIYIGVATTMCICVMLILPEVLKLFTDRNYWTGVSLISPIVLASYIIFLYSLSVDVEYYYKTTKIIAFNTIIAAIVNVVLNFIFIPMYGAIAAAYTTVASYSVSFFIHYNYAHRIDCELFKFNIYILPIITVLLSVVVSSFFTSWLIRWSVALIVLVSGLFYYKDRTMTLARQSKNME